MLSSAILVHSLKYYFQLPITGSSRRRKREPRRRVPFEGVTGTQTSTCTENASCKGSSSRRRARKRTTSFDDSGELIPKKTVRRSTSSCEISKVADKDTLRPSQTLIAKHPRTSEVSQVRMIIVDVSNEPLSLVNNLSPKYFNILLLQ